jgi:hypothetical protein
MGTAAVFAVLGIALVWIFFSGRDSAPEPTAHRKVTEEIDVRDWGPGATPPPVA